jgi:hypothetical protein
MQLSLGASTVPEVWCASRSMPVGDRLITAATIVRELVAELLLS